LDNCQKGRILPRFAQGASEERQPHSAARLINGHMHTTLRVRWLFSSKFPNDRFPGAALRRRRRLAKESSIRPGRGCRASRSPFVTLVWRDMLRLASAACTLRTCPRRETAGVGRRDGANLNGTGVVRARPAAHQASTECLLSMSAVRPACVSGLQASSRPPKRVAGTSTGAAGLSAGGPGLGPRPIRRVPSVCSACWQCALRV